MKIDRQTLGTILVAELDEDENGEFIQIIAPEDDEEGTSSDLPSELPILTVRNTVLFPEF